MYVYTYIYLRIFTEFEVDPANCFGDMSVFVKIYFS